MLTHPSSSIRAVFTSIEVCAGAGGQAIGLHRAGFRHLSLVEIDKHAAETLRINGQRTRWWKPSQVHEVSLVGWKPDHECVVDLIAGGVPCPPFSIAGRQLGADDERDLFPSILDLVELIRPRAVMIENVRGLLSSRFDTYREEILRRLNELGYFGEWKLLEAHDFGVPQLRPRSVLVALPTAIWDSFEWPKPNATGQSVGEALFELMSENGWGGARKWAQNADGIAPTLVGGSKKHGGADLGPTRAKKAWAERHGVDALGVADSSPPPNFKGMPRLTVQMAAVIQGFPPDWQFAGKKTASYRQVGNAFPPPVAEAVGRQIARALRKVDKSLDADIKRGVANGRAE
jgi:DNA (cytosine-5)-methyltransferase 1